MTVDDSCCLTCQDIFPVAPRMFAAPPPGVLDENQWDTRHTNHKVNGLYSGVQAPSGRNNGAIDRGQPLLDVANQWSAYPNSSRQPDDIVLALPMSYKSAGRKNVPVADVIDSFDKEHAINGTQSKEIVMMTQDSKFGDEKAPRSQMPQKRRGKVNPRSDATTTMMICNIPCRVSTETLIEAIEAVGFGGTYEFLHLPCRYGQEASSNLGYGFVNFLKQEDAAKFAVAFEGYHFEGSRSVKKCTVKVASFQGFNANAKRPSRKCR